MHLTTVKCASYRIYFCKLLIKILRQNCHKNRTSAKENEKLTVNSKKDIIHLPSNFHFAYIEYSEGIYSRTLVVNDFSEIYSHPSILLIKDSRSV